MKMYPSRYMQSRLVNNINDNMMSLGLDEDEDDNFRQGEPPNKRTRLEAAVSVDVFKILPPPKGNKNPFYPSCPVPEKYISHSKNSYNRYYNYKTTEGGESLRRLAVFNSLECSRIHSEQLSIDVKDLRRAEKIRQQAEDHIVSSNYNYASCVELLTLDDPSFEIVIQRRGNKMEIAAVDSLMTIAWARNAEGELKTNNNRKFELLAQYAVLPKLMDPNVTLRAIFPSFEKLAAIDKNMIIDKILLPLIQGGKTLHKSLYAGIKTEVLLEKTLEWIKAKSVTLDRQLMTVFTSLLGSEFPALKIGDLLLGAIRHSIIINPTDGALGSFTFALFKRFEKSMSKEHLHTAMSDNFMSQTMFREPILKVLALQILHRVKPNDIFGDGTTSTDMECE